MESGSDKPLVVIACDVLQDMIEKLLPVDQVQAVTFLDFGLHAVPKKMKAALQQAIDGIPRPSMVLLGYGLCGNGLKGIRSGRHTLVLPRVDDCVAVMLGSREAYRQEFAKEPGTYYLARGWLERSRHQLEEVAPALSGYTADPLANHELLVERYGLETADWLMDQQYRNYRRLALVAADAGDLERYRQRAMEVAGFCSRWNMRYEELLGSPAYARRLIQAGLALRSGQDGNPGDEFLVIPPGEEIRSEQFM